MRPFEINICPLSECSGTAVPTEHILLQDLGLRGELFKITIQILYHFIDDNTKAIDIKSQHNMLASFFPL